MLQPLIEPFGVPVTVLLHVLVHPPGNVVESVYVPAVVTLIHCVDAPVLHE